MNVEVMQEPMKAARKKLWEYERELGRAADDELSEVLVGLEAMADGYPVVHLSKAIQDGGHRGDLQLPNLAVARADKKRVQVHSRRPASGDRWWDRRHYYGGHVDGVLIFDSYGDASDRGQSKAPEDYEGLMMVEVGVGWTLQTNGRQRWYADVPLIPPGPRRKCGGKTRLKDHLVLWEVDKWHTDAQPKPPRDPMLLRPLGGEMYAVVAQWDLSPLERAVIHGRKWR